MKTVHAVFGAMMGVLLAGPVACFADDDGRDDGAGTTGAMQMEDSTGEDPEGSTGRPVPIPPDEDSGDPPDPDSGDTTGTEPPAELDCMSYCDIYLAACQDFDEYANLQHCMDNCAQWPIGDAADIGGDSLGCRTYHATVAASTDAALHCPHAGPSGALVCVAEDAPTCDLYCTRYFNNCEGDLNLWASMEECLDTCGGWYPGTATDSSGHTIGCRAYYANLAAGDAMMHCPNAGPGGGEACVLGG